ncbi:unnamed protein product, partial [marine sediment metagenome]
MAIWTGDYTRTVMNFYLGDGTLCQNVYTHKRTGVGVYTDATTVAALASWAETMYAEIDDIVKDDIVEALSTVDEIAWSGTKWEIIRNVGTFTISFIPTGGGPECPNQVAPLILFRTARPRTVGKKYLPPIIASDLAVGGRLDAGVVSAVVAFADDAVN